MDLDHVACLSFGKATMKRLVSTTHPRIVFRSEGLASARNFGIARRSSLGKDSVIPCRLVFPQDVALAGWRLRSWRCRAE